MPYNLYPQTDLNQQNLDWIVSRIKELETLIANGGVKVVTLAADMTNHGVIYVYEGSEAGMNTDHWYYWDNASQTWVDGGGWGGGAVSLPLAVSDGGTGAVNASGARTNLGLGTVAVENAPLAIAKGGTGTTTAAGIRNAIGLGNSTGTLDVTHGGTGQTTKAAIRNSLGLGNTTGALPVANGGTGSTTASAALTALGAEPAITLLPVNKGGTGANSAAGARAALGLGTLAVENAPLSVAKGGTGETSLAGLKDAMGLSILTAYHTELPGSTTTDIPVPNFFHGIMLISGPLASSNGGLCILNTNSSGNVSRYDVNVPSGLTLTNGTAKVSCANSTSYKCYAMLIGEVIS